MMWHPGPGAEESDGIVLRERFGLDGKLPRNAGGKLAPQHPNNHPQAAATGQFSQPALALITNLTVFASQEGFEVVNQDCAGLLPEAREQRIGQALRFLIDEAEPISCHVRNQIFPAGNRVTLKLESVSAKSLLRGGVPQDGTRECAFTNTGGTIDEQSAGGAFQPCIARLIHLPLSPENRLHGIEGVRELRYFKLKCRSGVHNGNDSVCAGLQTVHLRAQVAARCDMFLGNVSRKCLEFGLKQLLDFVQLFDSPHQALVLNRLGLGSAGGKHAAKRVPIERQEFRGKFFGFRLAPSRGQGLRKEAD
jgi:hypothetical protein